KSVREVLEKRGFLEPRSARHTHTKPIKSVYEAAPIRRVRSELRIVVEPATQGHGCGAGTEHGLAEVAGVVALHVDRIRERACCRRTVFALAALALVFVFDPATHGRSIAYVPVEQRARRRSPHPISAPERAILARRIGLIVIEQPRLL